MKKTTSALSFLLAVAMTVLTVLTSAQTLPAAAADAEVAGASAVNNLIANPSFEDGSNWSFGSIYRSSGNAHTGSYCAKTNVRGQSVVVCTTQEISVAENTDYILSGYVYRADNSTWGYIDMNDMTNELQLLDTSVYGKWQYVCGLWNSQSNHSLRIRMVVEPNYTINQHLREGITGDCLFDDISLTPVSYEKYSETAPTLPAGSEYYSLRNSDISVTVAHDSSSEYLTEITNNATGCNWINKAARIALPMPLSDNATVWQYSGCTFDNSRPLSGTGADACHTLKFTYTSTNPNLSLDSYWRIYPTGPIYRYCEITNNSGHDITYPANNITCGDILLKVPDNTTVYRFNRSRYNNGFDGSFTTGVYKSPVTTDMFLKNTVENSWLKSSGMLPFELLQSNDHGLYFGYCWSYGQMLMQTQSNKGLMRISADLGFSPDTVTKASGEKLVIPAVFYGAYSGNADDGSNQMKRWFYNHLMTDSLRENPQEPLIEFHLPLFSESELKRYLDSNNLEEYGVELTKMDYWWTVPDDRFDAVLEQQWNPDRSKWPNGMTYGSLVKSKYPSLRTSLYMCDTYQGVDIGTASGQQQQIQALTQRMRDWKIDYWRSDFDLLKPDNYSNFEGLMNILDTMRQNNSNFRYEHCSAGGSLKDFETLQRATFMTMEDSGGALNHRMAFYSNSYMINPVQLKFDLGFDWTSSEDAAYISGNQKSWTVLNVRTAMLGAMMVQNVSSNLTDIQKAELIRGWNLYKTRQRPILKGADVYHILPMPDGRNWDGVQYYNRDIGKGSLFLFRDKNIGAIDSSSKTIKLKGLEPDTRYSLEFEDRSEQNTVKSGSELMNTGITVSGLGGIYDSEIVWIEKHSDPVPTTPVATQPATSAPTAPLPTATASVPTTQASSVFGTQPHTEYVIIGDADLSGKVTVRDATLIQRVAADAVEISAAAEYSADIDSNSRINIRDATAVQRYCADLYTGYEIGQRHEIIIPQKKS